MPVRSGRSAISFKLRFPHMAGYFQLDTKHLYVSPGSGTWGPTMRLGTRSELTIVDLLPGQ